MPGLQLNHPTAILEVLKESLILHEVVTDETGNVTDLRYLDSDSSLAVGLKEVHLELSDHIRKEILGVLKTEAKQILSRVVSLHESIKFERYIEKLGKWFEILVFSPSPGQVASLSIDITLRKKAENELHVLNATLEDRIEARTKDLIDSLQREKALNDLKSNFVSMASHQFRTPLTTILSSVRLIEKYIESTDKDKCYRHLSKIRGSVGTLTDILDDILSLEKLEQGRVYAKMEQFDLRVFVQTIVDDLSDTCKEQQEIIYNHVGDHMVLFDKTILKNVLLNLLSNGIKYSDRNIELTSVVEDKVVTLIIADKGIGIPEEDMQHLFERFHRARNAGNTQGTGLGLHIVKQYLDLINGSIDYVSKENEGTTFTLRLPQNSKDAFFS